MSAQLALLLLTLVASSLALPGSSPTISSETALKICQQLGVNIQDIYPDITQPTEDRNRLAKCFHTLVAAEQTLSTEAAMLMILVRQIETRRDLGEPVTRVLSREFPAAIPAMKKAKILSRVRREFSESPGIEKVETLSRVKRQFPGMTGPMGGGEPGEDPGKRLRKMRLGLPLTELGEDPGKRMRNRGMHPVPAPFYPRPVYPYQMAQPYYWGQSRYPYPYPYPYYQAPPKKTGTTTPLPW